MRKSLCRAGVGLLVLSFVLAFLAPALGDVPAGTGCGMSCCRPGHSMAKMSHGKTGSTMPSCGHCHLRSGSSGSFAVLPLGLPPSLLPAPTILPTPPASKALLAAPGGRLVHRIGDLPDQPPRG